MQKIIKSDKKIKYTLLSIIFIILFILTTISYPINTYAESSDNYGDTPSPTQKVNLDSYSSNEVDESANLTAGYLYYAASSDRCGVLFYVVDNDGRIVAKGVLLEEDLPSGKYADNVNKKMIGTWMTLGESTTPNIEYVEGISPVGYNDSTGWYGKGSASMNYLTSIPVSSSGEPFKIEIDGVKMTCPYWALYVAETEGGKEALKGLANPLCKWQLFLEPVSVNYLYTTNTFEKSAINDVHDNGDFSVGSPIPLGQWVDAEQTKYKPTVYLGTASNLLNESFEYVGDNRYTWKMYHTQLPFSLCLEHDEEIPAFTSAHSSCYRKVIKGVPEGSLTTLSSTADYNGRGIAIAALDIGGFQLPPIHTFDTTTPGNPETPDPEKGTDGDCVITKLYYTEVLSPDGEPVETKDFYSYRMSNTTNYISIDEEEGYEIEAWRASSTNFNISTSADGISTIKRIPGTGSGSSVETLDVDNGQKYLYVLYKKVEVQEEESEFDFEILESQITNRVSFYQGTSKTKELVMKEFSWRSEEHYVTECFFGGWHEYSGSCSPYWIDDEAKLGIKLDIDSINKAVISDKRWAIKYDDRYSTLSWTEYDTKIISDRNYPPFYRTNTGYDRQKFKGYNLIAMLFRGQDKLTLAAWKNKGATTSYLTNLSYESDYNDMKSVFIKIKIRRRL